MVDDLRLLDDQERQAIATDLDTTFLVEAAAGTGKTTSMVIRMVALISEGKVEAHRMAAITFTRKAAAHLRQKFQNELEKASAREPDPLRKSRLAAALEEFDSCYIGTIHSFCARLLRERPVEAGIDPGFTEIEEAENAELRDICWHEYTQRLFIEESPLLVEMDRFGVTFDSLKATYDTLCQYPDVEPVVVRVAEPDLSTARSRVSVFLESAGGRLPAEIPDGDWDALQKLLRRAIQLMRILDVSDPVQLVKILEVMSANAKVTQNRWSDRATALQMQEDFISFKESVVQPALTGWREYLHPILIGAVVPAVSQFARYRQEHGSLSFEDLLVMARDLLRKHPHIRRYFRERYTHLLIDEFQDTDPIQAEMMLYLTGEDTNEMDWRRARPAPGALFVVGDPKQSIYRFRRADITTYNSVREIVESSGGRVLRLATNFRSAQGICGHVNTAFEGLFPPDSTEKQAAHVPLHPRKADSGDVCGVYKLEFSASEIKRMLGGGRASNGRIIAVDSEAISGWIRAALDSGLEITDGDHRRPVSPGDFLIILRGKTHLSKYAQALESRGIPFEISGGGGFAESEEIAALIPFLKSVVDPDDSLSLLAYLRGPLCGASDSALYAFKRSGGRFNFNPEPPGATDEAITTAYELLREARNWSRELPPAAALGRICERLGIIAHAAALDFGNTRAGNLLKMLVLARNLSIEGKPFAAIAAQVEELGGGDVEEMGVDPGRGDAVRLMNLHKSKGLEAPIVFLACPTDGREHPPRYFVDRSTDPPTGHFLITAPYGDHADREIARPADWDSRSEIEKQFQQAEDDRLLYVAATRPMNALVISVYQSETKGTAGPRGPWVKLAEGVTEPLPEIELEVSVEVERHSHDLSDGRDEALAGIKSRIEAAGVPGYAVTQVTKISHEQGAKVRGAGVRGHGSAWGSVLHGCLEALMRNPSLEIQLLAANLLRQEEVPLDDLDEIVRLVESVLKSSLWAQACAAERRLVEVPFALQVLSSDLGATDGPAKTILHGVIDLVFKDAGGWVIVDYKSDVTAGRLSSLIAAYALQVNCYKRYWEQFTGEPVRAALYFVDGEHMEWL